MLRNLLILAWIVLLAGACGADKGSAELNDGRSGGDVSLPAGDTSSGDETLTLCTGTLDRLELCVDAGGNLDECLAQGEDLKGGGLELEHCCNLFPNQSELCEAVWESQVVTCSKLSAYLDTCTSSLSDSCGICEPWSATMRCLLEDSEDIIKTARSCCQGLSMDFCGALTPTPSEEDCDELVSGMDGCLSRGEEESCRPAPEKDLEEYLTALSCCNELVDEAYFGLCP